VKRYILEIVHASREHEDVLLGGSPRATIALFRTAQAMAAVNGRDFALPDDVKKMAQPVLSHRLILKPESRLRKRTANLVVKDLVDDAKVPITDKQKAANEDYFG
jgi:MoxR-like ATPase